VTTGGERLLRSLQQELDEVAVTDGLPIRDLIARNGARGFVASNVAVARLARAKDRPTVVIGLELALHCAFGLALLKWRRRCRLVWWVTHLRAPQRSLQQALLVPLQVLARWVALLSADGVIAHSRCGVRECGWPGWIRRHRFTVVPPALRDRAAAEPRRGVSAAGSRLLLVGNWDRRKGIDVAVRALAALHSRTVRLVIVGRREKDPRYFEEVMSFARSAAMVDRIELLQDLTEEELAGEYARADIFVLPSHWEGYGMAVAEAMTYGLPIISTAAGAIPELVRSGVNGILVRPGDARGVAKAVETLTADPDLRRSMGRASIDRSAAFPSAQASLQAMVECILSVARTL
jgi:glycosyltransferase involved in cell wall biosynthesis